MCFNIFLNVINSCDGKAEFSSLLTLSTELLSTLKSVVVLNIVFYSIESSTEQHLFKIKIFSNILNVFTVTSDQFSASLLKLFHLYII